MTGTSRLRELLEKVQALGDLLNALPSLLDELDRLRSPVSKEALAAVEAGAAETLAAIQRAKEDQEYEEYGSLDRFQGRMAEREAIVAWMRDAATELRSRGIDGGEPIAKALDITVAGIAFGAHIKGGQEG